ncbi:hypothetical protein [Halobaculum lipolyticum]|uniref:Small CPxCG-related zinc finger protein n=1 Tax=Halobaculum lipolyticum TaxID=3032001 RepID=A0ABD5W8H6_9EURY|nr:hypothetical protein [Halobaculum sp. DT31]
MPDDDRTTTSTADGICAECGRPYGDHKLVRTIDGDGRERCAYRCPGGAA